MLSFIFYALIIVIGIAIIGVVISLLLGAAGLVLAVIGTIVGTIWRYKFNLLLLAAMLWLTGSPILSLLVYIIAVYFASRRDASKNITGQLTRLLNERPVSYQEVEDIRPEDDSLSHKFRKLTYAKGKGLKIMQKWVKKGTITSKKLSDDKVYYYKEELLVEFENKVSDRTVKYLNDEFEKFGLYDAEKGVQLAVLYHPLRSLENAYQEKIAEEILHNQISQKRIEKIYLGEQYEKCIYIEPKRLYKIGESLIHQDIFNQQELEGKLGKHSVEVYIECISQWKTDGFDFSVCNEKLEAGFICITPQLKHKAVNVVDEPVIDLKKFIFGYDKYTIQELVCAMKSLTHEISGFNFKPATDSEYQCWINVKFKKPYQCDACKKIFMNLVPYNGLQFCGECLEALRKEERKKEKEVITEKKYIDAPPPDVIVKLH